MGGGYEPEVALGQDDLSVRLDPKQGRFSVRRGTRTIFTFALDDLSSNAEVLWSPNGRAFALNYSEGGAIGGLHVRLSLINGDKVTDASPAVQPAVNDFKSRHFYKSRGNNVTALKWVPDSSDLVLMTEVYPTSDCGSDLGHAEAYIVAVSDGKIRRHLTLTQLRNLPGICPPKRRIIIRAASGNRKCQEWLDGLDFVVFRFRQFPAHFCNLGVNLLLLGLESGYEFFRRRDFGLRTGQHCLGEALETLMFRRA